MAENLYTSQTPDSLDNAEDTYTMGTEMVFAANGTITGIRWRSPTNAISTSPSALIYSTAGTQLAIKAAGALTAGNTWNTITFDTPLAVTAGTYYVAAFGPINRYSALAGMHSSADVTSGNITAPRNGVGGHVNGRFTANAAPTFPTSSGGAGYFVDVLFEATTSQGGTVAAAQQVTVTTTATLLDINTTTRGRALLVRNRGTLAVYIGGPDVTTGTGFQLDPGEAVSLDADDGPGVATGTYGRTASSTARVDVLQVG